MALPKMIVLPVLVNVVTTSVSSSADRTPWNCRVVAPAVTVHTGSDLVLHDDGSSDSLFGIL